MEVFELVPHVAWSLAYDVDSTHLHACTLLCLIQMYVGEVYKSFAALQWHLYVFIVCILCVHWIVLWEGWTHLSNFHCGGEIIHNSFLNKCNLQLLLSHTEEGGWKLEPIASASDSTVQQ